MASRIAQASSSRLNGTRMWISSLCRIPTLPQMADSESRSLEHKGGEVHGREATQEPQRLRSHPQIEFGD